MNHIYLCSIIKLKNDDMNNNKLIAKFGDGMKRIENAILALQSGKGVLLIDDESRENEGDLIFPAQTMTVKDMALMIRECSGIVCLCLTPDKARSLELDLMVSHNNSRYGTNFTVSIEATHGVTTGVSASDRITTIKTAISETAKGSDLSKPGHVFPLIANENGVLGRDGHTEGSVDLMKLAKLPPSAVLCELMNSDGTMSNLRQIIDFATKHDYPIVSILDIIEYRHNQ